MLRKAYGLGVAVVLLAATEGFAVSNQVETLMYDTHQKVTSLSKSLDGAVQKLNDTTSQLLERVNESENQTRQLRSLVEENQVKLDGLEQQIGQLTATIYQQFNLTTSGSGYTPASPGSVVIEPPSSTETTVEEVNDVGDVDTVSEAPPQSAAGNSAAANAAYQEAQRAWLNQDFPNALQLFTEYLARYPGTEYAGYAQYWQGRCYIKMNRFQEAVDSLEKVRMNYPENETKVSQAMHQQAYSLYQLGRNDEAIRLYEEVIRRYPGTVVAQEAQSDLDVIRKR